MKTSLSQNPIIAGLLAALLLFGQNPTFASAPSPTLTPTPQPGVADNVGGGYFPYSKQNVTFPADLKNKIKHIVIIFPENNGFDSLYSSVPGVNGISNAPSTNATQTDAQGNVAASLAVPNVNGQTVSQTVNLNSVNGATPVQVTALKANGWHGTGVIPSNYNATTTADTQFQSNGTPITSVPNAPYDVGTYVSSPLTSFTGDMIHNFFYEQYQINNHNNAQCVVANDSQSPNGSPMSKFAAFSTNPGLTMSHRDASNDGEGQLARSYTICDNAFHSAFGGSFLNHQFLIAARAPVWLNFGGASGRTTYADGTKTSNTLNPRIVENGAAFFTPSSAAYTIGDSVLTNKSALSAYFGGLSGANNYWAVNTILPVSGPAGAQYSSSYTGANAPVNSVNLAATAGATQTLLPVQTHNNIGDLLTQAGQSWAWYSEGWGNAVLGKADFLYQFHHQPFAYFAKYALSSLPNNATNADGTVTFTAGSQGAVGSPSQTHLLDFDNGSFDPASTAYDNNDGFLTKCQNNTLESVAFVKPIGEHNAHPGYASVHDEQVWISNLVSKIQNSAVWSSTVIFIMYDEHGGRWDHVVPPMVDPWGPGSRVPLIVISPFAKTGYVDHTFYDTTSLLAFIEGRFGLQSLGASQSVALESGGPTTAYYTRDSISNMPLNSLNYDPSLDAGTPSILAPVATKGTTYAAANPLTSVSKLLGLTGTLQQNGVTFTWSGNTRTGFSFDANGNMIGQTSATLGSSAYRFTVLVTLAATNTAPQQTYAFPLALTAQTAR